MGVGENRESPDRALLWPETRPLSYNPCVMADPADESPAEVRTAAAPDWDEIDEDIPCPRCGYNLRGLSTPRCPECGYQFVWPELLDPQYRLHPYLYEHQVGMKARAFYLTLVGGLRPRRFWRDLRLVQPSYRDRLITYWGICAAMCVPGFVAARFCLTAYWSLPPRGGAGFLRNFARFYDPRDFAEQAWGWVAVPLVWPWVTFLALMIFQVSMRKARVKPMHVMRCVLYSYDVVFWVGAGWLLMTALAAFAAVVTFSRDPLELSGFYPVLWLPAALVATDRMWVAYAKYLRFDRPLATILASQVIAFLVALNLFLPLTW